VGEHPEPGCATSSTVDVRSSVDRRRDVVDTMSRSLPLAAANATRALSGRDTGVGTLPGRDEPLLTESERHQRPRDRFRRTHRVITAAATTSEPTDVPTGGRHVAPPGCGRLAAGDAKAMSVTRSPFRGTYGFITVAVAATTS
jgi:hypothetical protein